MHKFQAPQFIFRFGSREYNLSSRTHIMGVLNVTPDSFSDGGRYLDPVQAVEQAIRMAEEGADFIDIGGESTRPKSRAYGEGADSVSAEEELRRVLPVIKKVAATLTIPISIDTYKSEVADQALCEGATIVNDISGFGFDPRMPSIVAAHRATAVVMHIKGTPKTMQASPTYDDLIGEVSVSLERSVASGREAGIEQIVVDPGLGFGKRQEDNLELIHRLSQFERLGCPILVGPSRKTFIGNILNLPIHERLEGSLAAAVVCVLNGAQIIRVHDVMQTKRAVILADALRHDHDTHKSQTSPS